MRTKTKPDWASRGETRTELTLILDEVECLALDIKDTDSFGPEDIQRISSELKACAKRAKRLVRRIPYAAPWPYDAR